MPLPLASRKTKSPSRPLLTGVVSLPVLLPGVGSAPLPPSSLAVALLMIWLPVNGLLTLSVIVTVAEPPPAARLPMAQVTVPLLLAAAVGSVAEHGAGRDHVGQEITPMASWLPLLVTVIV